jgi:hypothetical protein
MAARRADPVTPKHEPRQGARAARGATPTVESWMRWAGLSNRALARYARQPRIVLARFDTGEHALFGTDRVVFVRGDVSVTESDMLTMGDLYERPEDMYQADVAELRELVKLIRQDREHYRGVKGVKSITNKRWSQATPKGPHRKKTYMDLAKENATHYAPRAQGDGRDNKAEWERIHRQALDIMHAAKTPGDKQRAEAYNAFAGHFLTDAFSAGHLIAKQDVVERARRNWDAQETFFSVFKETVFTRAVARGVLKHKDAGPKLRPLYIRIVDWQKISEVNLSELLYQIGDTAEYRKDFFDTFVKVIHDLLNKTGVEVDNARGDGPWTLYGDQHLDKSPETLRIGQAAFQESWVNLMEAEVNPGPLDYRKLFKQVWDYTPKPTAAAQAWIDNIVVKAADPSTAESISLYTEMLAEHVDDMIEELGKVDRLGTEAEVEKKMGEKIKNTWPSL